MGSRAPLLAAPFFPSAFARTSNPRKKVGPPATENFEKKRDWPHSDASFVAVYPTFPLFFFWFLVHRPRALFFLATKAEPAAGYAAGTSRWQTSLKICCMKACAGNTSNNDLNKERKKKRIAIIWTFSFFADGRPFASSLFCALCPLWRGAASKPAA